MILIHSTTLRNAQAMLSGSTEKPSGSWGPSLSDGWTYFSKYNYEYSYEDSVHYAATQGAHQFTGDLAVIRIILDEGAAGFSEGENKQHFDRWYEDYKNQPAYGPSYSFRQ